MGPYLSSTHGSAALQRALGVSQSLVATGATVRIGTGDAPGAPVVSDSELPPGITVEPVRRRTTGDSNWTKAISWFSFANDVIRWLETHDERPDAVILYGGGQHLARTLDRWSKRHGVATIADVVEWYDPRRQPLGSLGPFAQDLERAMHDGYARTGNVIAVSDLLARHFSGLGCRTIVVPPITDVRRIPASGRHTEARPLRFAYAGSPGRKDLLRHVVDGLELADPSGRLVRLDVAGPDAATLGASLGRATLPNWIHCHGRLSRRDVLDLIGSAHYVPLLRPDERFAHAGFPTKVVESFGVGTPVIANLTSDLGRHLRDGLTGFVAADASAHSFARAVSRALVTTAADYAAMRRACRRHAESAFDFRSYTETLTRFVGEALVTGG